MPWPSLDPRTTTVTADDGVALCVQTHGPDDATATVLLLHGYELSQRLWARQVEALLARHPELRVVTYDHRGHGQSGLSAPGQCTIAQLGRDLDTVLGTVPEGPVVVVGHSMGGMTIMALAEQKPELFGSRITGVGLLGTSSGRMAEVTFGLPPLLAKRVPTFVPRVNALVRQRVERGKSKPRQPGMRWLLFGSAPDRLDVQRTLEVLDATPAATADDFFATFADHDRIGALGHLSGVPVLVACGDRDKVTPLGHSRTMAAAMPHADLVVYPGCGHMLMLERADDVNRRLFDLVAATARPALAAG